MRDYKWIGGIVALIGVLAVVLFADYRWDKAYADRRIIEDYEEIREFSISEYKEELNIFSSDKNIGTIEGADDVIVKAQELWHKEYGMMNNGEYRDPNPGESIEVFFDAEGMCWLVRGTPPPESSTPPGIEDWTGAIPCVIVRINGDVLAIWMG